MKVSTVFELVFDGGKQWDHRGVDHDDPVLGVIDDIGELFGWHRIFKVCRTAPRHGTAR